jgi:hypothetical protein
MKGVLPWLVRLAHSDGTRDFCHSLAALVGPVKKTIFPQGTQYLFICLSRPHCKKKVSDFPVPSRDVHNQTLPGRD